MRASRRHASLSWGEAQRALRDWYATPVGCEVHAQVAAATERMLRERYALHCLQLGGTQYGVDLLAGRGLIHRIHIPGDGADGLRAQPTALPLASGSVDLMVLGHALDFSDNPHALLRELDRVLALDGQVLAIGFNPWSLFGLRAVYGGAQVPWCGHFHSAARLQDWFKLLGWWPQQRRTVCFAPPVRRAGLHRRLRRLDAAGRWLPGQGGVQLLLARKHSVPLTPLPVRRLRIRRPVVQLPRAAATRDFLHENNGYTAHGRRLSRQSRPRRLGRRPGA